VFDQRKGIEDRRGPENNICPSWLKHGRRALQSMIGDHGTLHEDKTGAEKDDFATN
jgi:hypothetical protein